MSGLDNTSLSIAKTGNSTYSIGDHTPVIIFTGPNATIVNWQFGWLPNKGAIYSFLNWSPGGVVISLGAVDTGTIINMASGSSCQVVYDGTQLWTITKSSGAVIAG